MKGDFIIHPDDLLPLRSRMSLEQIGLLTISLCLSAIGEDPGDMDPVVGIAYDFFRGRIQREQEAYEKKAERNRANGRRHVGHTGSERSSAGSAAPLSSNASQNKADDSGSVTHRKPHDPSITQEQQKESTGSETEPREGLPIPNPNPDPILQKEICASGTPDALFDDSRHSQEDPYSADCPPDRPVRASSSRKKANSVKEANELFEKLWKLYPVKKGKGSVSAAKKREHLRIGEDHMMRALRRYLDDHNEREKQGGFVPNLQNGGRFFTTGYIDYLDKNYAPAPHQLPDRNVPRNGFVNYEQSGTDWDEVFEKAMSLQEEEAS